LYKVSQTESRYAYSTYAAFTLAEIGKLVISMTLYAKERPKHQSLAQAIQATRVSLKKPGLVFKIGTLAVLYFANNQLMFLLFLRADPASINLLKAGSGAITALVWCICMGRVVSQQQWIAIAIQACGLVVVQYDACKGQTVLAASAYGWILVSVLITAMTGVWNEEQLKTMPLTLHEQNIVIAGSAVFSAPSGGIPADAVEALKEVGRIMDSVETDENKKNDSNGTAPPVLQVQERWGKEQSTVA